MMLLAVFILIWAVLVAANLFISFAIETMWGSGASLLSFLGLFFVSIVVAWVAAVRVSKATGPEIEAGNVHRGADS